MKTITIPIAASLIAAAASVMLASCKLDSIDVHDTGSGKMASGAAHEEPCKIVLGSTTVDTVVVECDVGDGLGTIPATFTGPAGVLTGAIVKLMYDPLIIELPASAGTPTGFFTAGPFGLSSPLHITAGLTSIPIDAKTTLVAGPGKQLMIVDVPVDFTATGSMSATFSLHYIDLTHAPIKVIFAAKVPVGATTYYPPLLPCVTDFASVPEVPPGALTLAQVGTLLAGMTPCDHKAYDFGVAPPPPTRPDLNQHGLTGSWYESATDGQGVEVEVFPDLQAPGRGSAQVSWFTFDTAAGGPERQRWYTLSGDMVSGQPSASLKIYQNTGGNFNALPTTNGVQVGTATLSFDTCTSGQLSYSFNDGRSGAIPLTRITQNVTCSTTSARPTNADFTFSGNWYNATTDGQGFTAEVNPVNGTVFVPWYTYAPAGAGAGPAGQRWYTASSHSKFAPGSRSIPVDIFETTGGVFDSPTPPTQHSAPVGTGTLAFQTCSTATFGYNFTAGSSSGASGLIALTRIGPVPPGCVF